MEREEIEVVDLDHSDENNCDFLRLAASDLELQFRCDGIEKEISSIGSSIHYAVVADQDDLDWKEYSSERFVEMARR